MGFLNPHHNVTERAPCLSKLANAPLLAREVAQAYDFNVHLKKLVLFWAQTWKDGHPDATAHSKEDMNNCILAVTTELAIAAKMAGGSISLAIQMASGSATTRVICRQVFSDDSD